jgi:hypothetical protein
MRYKGGVISATAPTTSTSAASGVWTLPQQLQALAAGNWTGIPLVIGQAYQGGFYAGQIGTSGVATHNLVVAPVSSGQSSSKKWKNANSVTTGADSVIDGPQNTADMVADGSSTVYPAAHFCNDLVIGGFSDWYLPARNELDVCYYNLKPTTDNNDTTAGINANAVPARASNYTIGTPAQTSAAAFIVTTGAQAFSSAGAANNYWTSTQFSATGGKTQRFSNGDFNYENKSNSYSVRAVRRVAV